MHNVENCSHWFIYTTHSTQKQYRSLVYWKVSVTFCVFRVQFGQSRSFNSLSHKNLIMNMEPLVPALPSTNECEDTAGDSGSHTHTHTKTHSWLPNEGLHKVTWCLPRVGKSTCTCTIRRHNALIEQLMLTSLHQSYLPGDPSDSMLKILLP